MKGYMTMKKQWILIVVLAALLVAAVIIASRSFPDVSRTPGSNSTDTTQTTGSESTDPSNEDVENTFPTISYEEYQNMSGDDRTAYRNQFSSVEAYEAWHDAAKAAYEANRATIPVIEGDINLEDFINKEEN